MHTSQDFAQVPVTIGHTCDRILFLIFEPGKQFSCIPIEPQNLFAFYSSKPKHLIEYEGGGKVRDTGPKPVCNVGIQ